MTNAEEYFDTPLGQAELELVSLIDAFGYGPTKVDGIVAAAAEYARLKAEYPPDARPPDPLQAGSVPGIPTRPPQARLSRYSTTT